MGRVLLVGATSAIALATARLLAGRGDQLYVVGRDPTKLQGVLDDLGSAVVGHERLDLTDHAAHPELVRRAADALGGIDVALICHGHLPDQARTEREWAQAEACFQVNLLSVVSLLMPLADHMERAGRGTIGVVTSVAGMRGRPRNFTYGAAKAGLSTYLTGLRSRLWRGGVRVVDLRPGPIVTPMTEGHPRNLLFATPEDIAPAIVSALDRGQAVRFLPWYWWVILQVVTRLPEPVFQRLGFLAGR